MLDTLRDLIIIVGSFKDAFSEYAQENLRQQSIGLNKNIVVLLRAQSDTLVKLPGKIAFGLETVMTAQEEGLKNLDKATLTLATEQRLTNQFSPRLYDVLNQVRFYTGLNNEGQAHLSEAILKSSLQYGVLTSKLTDALQGLLPIIETLGPMGVKIEEAAINLIGKLGPGVTGPLTKFLKEFLDPSIQSYQQLGIISPRLRELRAEFSRSTDALRKSDIIQEAAAESNARLVDLQKRAGFEDLILGLEAQTLNFNKNLLFAGKALTEANKLATKGQEVQNAVIQAQEKFNSSWVVLGKEVIDPIRTSSLQVGSVILDLISINRKGTVVIGQLIFSIGALIFALQAASFVQRATSLQTTGLTGALGVSVLNIGKVLGSLGKFLGVVGFIGSLLDIGFSIFSGKSLTERMIGFFSDDKPSIRKINADVIDAGKIDTEPLKIDSESLLRGYLDLFDESVHNIINNMSPPVDTSIIMKELLNSSRRQEDIQSNLNRNLKKGAGFSPIQNM